jgi:uncharacterized protein
MLTAAEIQAAADRIAEALKPKQVILFGSYARGEATEDSDLDLMVVAPQTTQTMHDAMVQGRSAVGSIGKGVDVIAFSNHEFLRRLDWWSSPVYWATREGKVLYDAQ